jgi:uracil-DNA glycosylase
VSQPAPLDQLIDRAWAEALAPVEPQIRAMGQFLRAENAAGRGYLPAGQHVLRAFTYPLDQVKVLIVGQDPYPTPGHPVGLSFSVAPQVRPLPGSLRNIFQELTHDAAVPPPSTGDLTPWCGQGVMLLNRVLSVQPGQPGSHRGKGWEEITARAIDVLVGRDRPLVAILWGRDAANLAPRLGRAPRIESAHPSPLSASRGFFGSRPFTRTNALLAEQGAAPVNWQLPYPELAFSNPAAPPDRRPARCLAGRPAPGASRPRPANPARPLVHWAHGAGLAAALRPRRPGAGEGAGRHRTPARSWARGNLGHCHPAGAAKAVRLVRGRSGRRRAPPGLVSAGLAAADAAGRPGPAAP